MESDLKKRRGFFVISKEFIEDNITEEFINVFKNFIPINIQVSNKYLFEDYLKYYGYSTLFRELKEGELIPEYNVIITRHKDKSKSFSVRFEEIKN